MKTSTLFCALSLLMAITFPSSHSAERCNPHDKKVLLQIKQAFNNPYHLASWDPNTDCCTWYVVECDRSNNRIDEIHLFQANVSGQIPPAIGDLPYLKYLTFRHITNLTGTIPPALTRLTRLQSLTISYTNVTGPIPSFLSQLETLTALDLSFNALTGSIPPSLASLRNLDELILGRNRLTGTIPESFGELSPTLKYLDISHNQISGTIPTSMGGLNLSMVYFSRNRLQGDASFLFGANKTLAIVDLSRNVLNFDLSKVVFPNSLSTLDLNHNGITGRLPEGLAKLNLQYLNVSYNRLCGEIPMGGELQSMDVTAYFHNKCLCGAPLPACK